MTDAFGGSDASGAWLWKDAYEAAEAAAVLFMQRYGRGMRRTCGAGPDGPRRMLAMLEAVAALEPSHTKRSEEQVRLQQFSTSVSRSFRARPLHPTRSQFQARGVADTSPRFSRDRAGATRRWRLTTMR